MQVLYSMSRDPNVTPSDANQRYHRAVDLSYELYLFNLLQFMRIAEYAKQDKRRKSAKLLPTEADKKFTDKLSSNELMDSLRENTTLKETFKKLKLEDKIDKDTVRSVYTDFANTDNYQSYIQNEDGEDLVDQHKQILLDLYKHCAGNERFLEAIEDHYPFWVDDKSLVVGAMKRSIKALPSEEDFFNAHKPTSETVLDFGELLLKKVNEDNDALLGVIEPTLKNWDADRVAVIDMILLKMAVCELLSFPTIPTKVTLNEFVEISKQYSTDKSKDFINGILDRLMKKLHKEGKIVKEGRGLVE